MVSAAEAQQTVSATSFMQKLGPELVAQGLTSHLVENTWVCFGGEDWILGEILKKGWCFFFEFKGWRVRKKLN